MNETTDSTFAVVVAASKAPVLVDFWAPWCKPCVALAPHVEKLAEEYKGKLTVVSHNCERHPGIPAQYGIMGLPAVYLFKDGRAVDALQGSVTPGRMREMLDKHGVTK